MAETTVTEAPDATVEAASGYACALFDWMASIPPFYWTPLVIFLSATIATTVAAIGWRQNRKLARENAAIEMLALRQREYVEAFRLTWWMIHQRVDFETIAKNPASGTPHQSWYNAQDIANFPIEQQQYMNIAKCLNLYENMATCIDFNVIDEAIIKRYLKDNLTFYVEALFPFIKAVRETESGDSDTWMDLENMARRWGADLPPKSR